MSLSILEKAIYEACHYSQSGIHMYVCSVQNVSMMESV